MEMPKSLEINRNNNNKKMSLTERDSTKEDWVCDRQGFALIQGIKNNNWSTSSKEGSAGSGTKDRVGTED